jgi:site-specific recombinase XerD
MTYASPSIGFASVLRDFFCKRLGAERGASPRTISSYRDTFRLLLRFVEDRVRRPASSMTLTELDAPLVLKFLDHLERDRNNSPRSRNARLAALRSFYRYAALRDPSLLPVAQRVLAIPCKRHDRPVLGFLQPAEMQAVQAAIDRSTWSGERDYVLFATMYNTGARVSEVIRLQSSDFVPSPSPSIHLRGKGRKERRVPLWRSTSQILSRWIAKNPDTPNRPLFPNTDGLPISRSGVAFRLRIALERAATSYPSLRGRRISPHTLRHTTAMHLLQSGVDVTVIALWLGHESPTTTHGYVEADLEMKKRALDKISEPKHRRARFKPSNSLLEFLDRL